MTSIPEVTLPGGGGSDKVTFPPLALYLLNPHSPLPVYLNKYILGLSWVPPILIEPL